MVLRSNINVDFHICDTWYSYVVKMVETDVDRDISVGMRNNAFYNELPYIY